MSEAKRYRMNFIACKYFYNSLIAERLSEEKVVSVDLGGEVKRLTSEQRTYRNLENLADSIMAGRIIGNFIEVNGENSEELYREFFG